MSHGFPERSWNIFFFEPHSYEVVIHSRIGFFFHFFLERAGDELSLEALHSASGV
jgi:hypothetical protein